MSAPISARTSYIHGYVQTARGALVDEDYARCDELLDGLVDRAKAIEEERDALIARVRELEAALGAFCDGYGRDPLGGPSREATKDAWRSAIAALYPGEPDHSQDALAMTWRKDPE